jgi:hypothetical protein
MPQRGEGPTRSFGVTVGRTHHASGEHEPGEDEPLLGGGRYHNRHCLRGLRRASACSEPEARTEIVVLDNLGAHKSERARELIEE